VRQRDLLHVGKLVSRAGFVNGILGGFEAREGENETEGNKEMKRDFQI
jgi:hypothetical protein